MSGHLERALVKAATDWPAFKLDPVWCMRYLELAAEFLQKNRTFTAELPLVHVIGNGMLPSPKLRDDMWISAFDMIMRLGWAAPLPQRLHGSKQWMSLL